MINAKTRAVELVSQAKELATNKAKTSGSAIQYIPEIQSHTIFVKATVCKRKIAYIADIESHAIFVKDTVCKRKITTRWYVNFQLRSQKDVINLIENIIGETKES